ncbi:MAG: pseudouridine synthase [Alphaproteobacteria bacterium]|nr:pseudouridine synthase [Alphaproteobacteria bacterium]
MTKKPEKSENPENSPKGERIAKRLARMGIASRREAERIIEAGRVSVDGKTLTSPALNVTEASVIYVDGKLVGEPEEARVWRYHKKAGTLTTNKDPEGRPTIFEKLPPELPRVITIGRLDFNTEGLLLLTNDGDLARHLELPQNAWIRHYRVRVYGEVRPEKLKALENGVTIDGLTYEPIKVEIEKEKQEGANKWLSVSIREGKNREIRKVMEHLGLQVTRLIRVDFGPFQLGKLARGGVEEVPARILREQLGKFFSDKRAKRK